MKLEMVERYLEPLGEILGVVRRGAAHTLVAARAVDGVAGFFVVHPDRRDRACWWLGWLAVDCRHQGRGLGRLILAAALERMRQIPGCRRVRLLVAADNGAARRLYDAAGFTVVGLWPATGELVMERLGAGVVHGGRCAAVLRDAYSLVQAMWLRLWRRGAPFAARLSGEFHGPPNLAAPAWLLPG